MTVAAGTRLGFYEIVEQIGAGGMGDVYRARDTRLDRPIAIKLVRADFSERFEREARSISALNHPHICTLHDVGEHDGTAYLVMEYVESRPLAGPLSRFESSGDLERDAVAILGRQAIAREPLRRSGNLSSRILNRHSDDA